jgi:hypothetical protein
MNPLGDNGLIVFGIGQVSVVAVAMYLFIHMKKGRPQRVAPKHRFLTSASSLRSQS